MIIAIDESGDFRRDHKKFSFMIAIHIRQSKLLYNIKMNQFFKWENSIPPKYKQNKGEIKSSVLPDFYLFKFVKEVLMSSPYIGITPLRVLPAESSTQILDKFKDVQKRGIEYSIERLDSLGREKQRKFYESFFFWLKKLSYEQYLKIMLLGSCIVDSLRNTIGTSIAGNFDEELVDMRFIIDEMNLKSREQKAFWHQILRNQLLQYTEENPIPLLDSWDESHPFLMKYASEGYINLNKLFWKNCTFASSNDYFEIRVSDAVGTILNRFYNEHKSKKIFALMESCILESGKVRHLKFNDFDLDERLNIQIKNPWDEPPEMIFE